MKTQENNVDQAELEKFSKMASHWWDRNGPAKPLHEINPIRLDFVKQRADLTQKKLLDVGCGGGIFSESLAEASAKVTGIDANGDLIRVAKLHLHESKHSIDYHKTTIASFATKHPHSYDIVTCMELLEHVPNPQGIIKSCAEMVKPDGLLFFSTINRNLTAYLKAVIGAEYLLGLLPRGTHDYDKFIKPSELSHWCRDEGFQLKALQGFNYNPLTHTYFACEDVNVNYMACYQHET